jgi:hypothetical protein
MNDLRHDPESPDDAIVKQSDTSQSDLFDNEQRAGELVLSDGTETVKFGVYVWPAQRAPADISDEDYTWTEQAVPAGLADQPINVGLEIRTLQQQMQDVMAKLRELDELRDLNAQLKLVRNAPRVDFDAMARQIAEIAARRIVDDTRA